jgi:RHS repeat-associated protein
VEGAGTKWYVTDRLGNVLGLVNSQAVMSGGQVATYPYGNTGQNIPLVAGSWLKVLTYAGPTAERRWAPPPTGGGLAFYDELEGGGRPWDNVAQLQNNRARWYSPLLGQFTTKDTYGYAAGDTNLYRYAGNSWPNGTDPSGHFDTPAGDTWADTLVSWLPNATVGWLAGEGGNNFVSGLQAYADNVNGVLGNLPGYTDFRLQTLGQQEYYDANRYWSASRGAYAGQEAVLGQVRTGGFAQISNASAAFGDTISGGLTSYVRGGLGYDDAVDYHAAGYRYGAYAGQVYNIVSMFANPASTAAWAVRGMQALNGLSTAGNLLGAAEAWRNDNMGQAALQVVGSAVPWLRGSGTICQALSRLGSTGTAVSRTLAVAQYGLNVVNIGMSGAEAWEKYQRGEYVGAALDLVSAGVSARRLFESCFAAGTPLLTPSGSKPIEHIAVGELLLSRAEGDPASPVAVKRVEEVFVRVAPILHLHVGGQVIRTTAEHPFCAYNKGWVAAGELRVGDRLLGRDGEWTAVEDLLDTGEWEKVYNLRVAEYHTYFVGSEEWGFSVWAHNADCSGELTRTGAEARRVLRESLGLPSSATNPQAAHHNIPWSLRNGPTGPIVESAARGGFNMNQRNNGLAMMHPHTAEAFDHPLYTDAVRGQLMRLPTGLSDLQYADAVQNISDRMGANLARVNAARGGTLQLR